MCMCIYIYIYIICVCVYIYIYIYMSSHVESIVSPFSACNYLVDLFCRHWLKPPKLAAPISGETMKLNPSEPWLSESFHDTK